MNALVESVARAIRTKVAELPAEERLTPVGVYVSNRDDILARAAIEATLIGLREPSEGMLRAALDSMNTRGGQVSKGYVDEDDAKLCWHGAIDQALHEVRSNDTE